MKADKDRLRLGRSGFCSGNGAKGQQNGRCALAKKPVHTTPRLVLSLEMGTTMRKKFLLCGHQQEEPYEGRLSRTVLWEGGGEIPLPDPIISHFKETENK